MMDSVTYKKEIVRMWDSLRENHKGNHSCNGVSCGRCPLDEVCDGCVGGSSYNAFEVISIVDQWSKEHPIIANADKFKEVFGVEPRTGNSSDYFCPFTFLGFEVCSGRDCYSCKQKFWKSEYKAPTESEE